MDLKFVAAREAGRGVGRGRQTETIVVLETGTAVTMPWLDKVGAVLEAWYGGSGGADAVANILNGDVNPSAKLPMTFPKSEADLPHPQLVKPGPGQKGEAAVMKSGEAKPTFSVKYDEGLKVGYKWYDAEKEGGVVSVWIRVVVHDVCLFGVKSDGRKRNRRELCGEKYRTRDGAEIAEGAYGAASKRRRTAEAVESVGARCG
jgi:beta-glucosidase